MAGSARHLSGGGKGDACVSLRGRGGGNSRREFLSPYPKIDSLSPYFSRQEMSLDIYLGPMFAGKSSAVLSIIRRNTFIGRKTLCLTSSLDNRYGSSSIVTHDRESCPALATKTLLDLQQLTDFQKADCVIIEEAQFFTDLKEFVLKAVEVYHKHVICVGLDGDSRREPFGQLLELIPYCDYVTKLKALCPVCRDGKEAIFTFRVPGAPTEQVNVAGADQYQALCRKHFLAMK